MSTDDWSASLLSVVNDVTLCYNARVSDAFVDENKHTAMIVFDVLDSQYNEIGQLQIEYSPKTGFFSPVAYRLSGIQGLRSESLTTAAESILLHSTQFEPSSREYITSIISELLCELCMALSELSIVPSASSPPAAPPQPAPVATPRVYTSYDERAAHSCYMMLNTLPTRYLTAPLATTSTNGTVSGDRTPDTPAPARQTPLREYLRVHDALILHLLARVPQVRHDRAVGQALIAVLAGGGVVGGLAADTVHSMDVNSTSYADVMRATFVSDYLDRLLTGDLSRLAVSAAVPGVPVPETPEMHMNEPEKRIARRFFLESLLDVVHDTTSFFESSFDVIEVLGSGGQGMVVKARNRLDKQLYAIKKVPLPCDDHALTDVLREVTLLARAQHGNIVRYYSAWVEESGQRVMETRVSAEVSHAGTTDEPSHVRDSTLVDLHADDDADDTGGGGVFEMPALDTLPPSQRTSPRALEHTRGFGTLGSSRVVSPPPLSLGESTDVEQVSDLVYTYDDDDYSSDLPDSDELLCDGGEKQTPCSAAHTFFGGESSSEENTVDSRQNDFINDLSDFDSSSGRNWCDMPSSEGSEHGYIKVGQINVGKPKRPRKQPAAVAHATPARATPARAPMVKFEAPVEPVESVGSMDDGSVDETRLQRADRILYIQMECCDGRTLGDALRNTDQPMNSDELWLMFRQLLEAMSFCHSRHIVHRDLKPSNIFIDDGQAKIGDFGLARALSTHKMNVITRPGSLANECSTSDECHAASSAVDLTRDVGTETYMAPEIRDGTYSSAVDIYALGIILFEMFNSFRTDFARIRAISALRNGTVDPAWRATHPRAAAIVLRMVDRNPEARPSAADLLNNPDYDLPRWEDLADEHRRRALELLTHRVQPDFTRQVVRTLYDNDVLTLAYTGNDLAEVGARLDAVFDERITLTSGNMIQAAAGFDGIHDVGRAQPAVPHSLCFSGAVREAISTLTTTFRRVCDTYPATETTPPLFLRATELTVGRRLGSEVIRTPGVDSLLHPDLGLLTLGANDSVRAWAVAVWQLAALHSSVAGAGWLPLAAILPSRVYQTANGLIINSTLAAPSAVTPTGTLTAAQSYRSLLPQGASTTQLLDAAGDNTEAVVGARERTLAPHGTYITTWVERAAAHGRETLELEPATVMWQTLATAEIADRTVCVVTHGDIVTSCLVALGAHPHDLPKFIRAITATWRQVAAVDVNRTLTEARAVNMYARVLSQRYRRQDKGRGQGAGSALPSAVAALVANINGTPTSPHASLRSQDGDLYDTTVTTRSPAVIEYSDHFFLTLTHLLCLHRPLVSVENWLDHATRILTPMPRSHTALEHISRAINTLKSTCLTNRALLVHMGGPQRPGSIVFHPAGRTSSDLIECGIIWSHIFIMRTNANALTTYPLPTIPTNVTLPTNIDMTDTAPKGDVKVLCRGSRIDNLLPEGISGASGIIFFNNVTSCRDELGQFPEAGLRVPEPLSALFPDPKFHKDAQSAKRRRVDDSMAASVVGTGARTNALWLITDGLASTPAQSLLQRHTVARAMRAVGACVYVLPDETGFGSVLSPSIAACGTQVVNSNAPSYGVYPPFLDGRAVYLLTIEREARHSQSHLRRREELPWRLDVVVSDLRYPNEQQRRMAFTTFILDVLM